MKLIEHFFRTIAPAICLGCGLEGGLLCAWCVEDTLPIKTERCYICNALSPESRTCKVCRRKSPLSHLWVRTDFSDIARKIVHRMKFSYSGEAADFIAKELLGILPALPPKVLLVHVPTTTNHVRQRGFDHARRMAQELSQLSGYPHLAALARMNQHRQVGATRRVRLQQMDNAFRVRHSDLLKDTHIVLIDDVITTGATLEAAARTLKDAGAKTIDALVFARAI